MEAAATGNLHRIQSAAGLRLHGEASHLYIPRGSECVCECVCERGMAYGAVFCAPEEPGPRTRVVVTGARPREANIVFSLSLQVCCTLKDFFPRGKGSAADLQTPWSRFWRRGRDHRAQPRDDDSPGATPRGLGRAGLNNAEAPAQLISGRGEFAAPTAAAVAGSLPAGSSVSVVASLGGSARGRRLLNAVFGTSFATEPDARRAGRRLRRRVARRLALDRRARRRDGADRRGRREPQRRRRASWRASRWRSRTR